MSINESRLVEHIESWLRHQLLQSSLDGFVVGVSGGIDSFVCAVLAKRVALATKKKMIAVALPIRTSEGIDGIDIKDAILSLGISPREFDLTTLYQEMLGFFPEASLVVQSNIRTRLRSTAIYTVANIENCLFIGTLNKTEYAIGYFQKNAANGDLLPLAKLAKREIRSIAAFLGIPNSFVVAKASGCVGGGVAEDEWGITEEEADQSINRDWEVVPSNSVSPEHLQVLMSWNIKTRHKRLSPPIFVPSSSATESTSTTLNRTAVSNHD
jgi:NAD+ synthase